MDWSRTKTIFIVTFMLLNIFLGYQLSEKQSQLNEVTLPELESRIEEQEINILIEDLEEEFMGAPITAYQRTFQEVLIEQTLESQTPQFLDETTIYSVLDSPYRLPNVNLQASVDAFLQQYVFRGEEYEVALYDEEAGIVGIYQTFDGKKIDEYEREDFHITLELNEEGDIMAYTQRYMNITEQGEEQELLTPIAVIEKLLNDTRVGIGAGSEVTSAELGYYNLMEVEANFQIFAPVWRVIIDEEEHYVNAMTGEVQRIS
ncbi:two-component system regulatory protein YycI [Alkalicoccus daliensis]|uniref:Two-component signal transduction system YycFG, regulatory protein YycI n=1 Tax=Alkalicoccus daliensis TaxID=745820 RepID=A0A1H0FQZ1_9BACI|nr:two-component system regulatory protein YycI [Alkalicoccus daliensis]SDN97004.1 Two-component signal transduction system YycFG, regulatory protein YycI [Alkalicoccus daliensis]